MAKNHKNSSANQAQNTQDSSNIHYIFQQQKSARVNDSKSCKQEQNQQNSLTTIGNFLQQNLVSQPIYALRPENLKIASKFFCSNFVSAKHKTKILYSVKSNPDDEVLKTLFANGINQFDVASLNEIYTISRLFGSTTKMYFMHPIKSREAITEAYFKFNIRDFSFDSLEELQKIIEATANATDLGLHLRIATPNNHSAINLSRKFGILADKAVSLIRKARTVAKRLGICFHVGSQCTDPLQYRNAVEIAYNLITKAKVSIDVLDIGGGFPSSYPASIPPSLSSYFAEIFNAIESVKLPQDCEIWCEPGRALVAESTSLIVRVEGKKGQMLYLNDGTYGGLFDAGMPNFIYHSKAIRTNKAKPSLSNKLIPFGFYGPTCDSLDVMNGPFYLPNNIAEGDYIEIGQMGSYSKSIRTNFNGFNNYHEILVSDLPLVSLYQESQELAISLQNIKQI